VDRHCALKTRVNALVALHRVRGAPDNQEEKMDQKVYDIGMKMRRKVAGDAYVDKAMAGADDFNRDFQRLVTQYCWGEAWGDDALPPRERSILNLGMIASLGRMEEFQTHVRGALNNGMTPNEIRAVLTQIAIYCGIPVGVDCFRHARPIIAEWQKNNPK
jgi:4-carboxymuconolactone decarboxylase